MNLTEIIMLFTGAALFLISFFIPDQKEKLNGQSEKLAKDEIQRLVSKELDAIRDHVDDVVDEAVTVAMEKTERSLERLSNEKIMAVNEYSELVLKEINRNHDEAMFLYDMLNDKHTNLKNTVNKANQTMKEVEVSAKEAEVVVNTYQNLTQQTLTPQSQMPQGQTLQGQMSQGQTLQGQTPQSQMPQDRILPASAKQEEFAPLLVPPISGNESFSKVIEPIKLDLAQMVNDTANTSRNSNDKVLECYRNGDQPIEIARKLGLGVGEVKLVIDLYKAGRT